MTRARRLAALAALPFLIVPASASCQDGAGSKFTQEQLEQMVAPIALYPDPLVSSVLMGATYPLEIVEADRWLGKNPGVTGTALDAALKDQTWDPSVKSLVAVPEVLKRMSEGLDWTRDLGDAFLGQKAEIMDAVQRMRAKAKEAGNLQTTEQQTVTVEQGQSIVIESTDSDVVYVPTYSTEVYGGGWAYPTPYYPYMYPPGGGLLAFGAGLAVGGALWGDCHWGSGQGDVEINVNKYNNFNTRVNSNFTQVNNKNWQHNPEHRGGVGYRDNQVAQKYGAAGGTNRAASDRARGRDTGAAAKGTAGGAGKAGANAGAGDRPGAGAGDRGGAGAGAKSAGAGAGGGAAPRPADGGNRSSSGSGGLSGSSSPQADRAASNRGSSSRGGGGGGGGGRSGGGGGRRR